MALLAPKRTLIIGGAVAVVAALYIAGMAKQHNESSSPAANPTRCRVTVNADVLNIRAAPAGSAPKVGQLTRGQESDADKVVQNGYRKLGENRWVFAEFATPLSGRDCG